MKSLRKGSALVAMAAAAALTLSACSSASDPSEGSDSNEPDAVAEAWTYPALLTDATGTQTQGEYVSLESGAAQGQDISACVLFPHTKDSWWVGGSSGIESEARRLGVSYDLYEAGGYENLPTQISQMEDCITQGYDVIVLASVHAEGVCEVTRQALEADIAVVDMVNGLACPDIEGDPRLGHRLVSYYEVGKVLGEHVGSLSEDLEIGFFPGPEGILWSDQSVDGFHDGLDAAASGGDHNVVVTSRSDQDSATLLSLMQDALTAYPEINAIASASVGPASAQVAFRDVGKSDGMIFAWAIGPDAYEGIREGWVTAGAADLPVMQMKMSMDTAVRLALGEELEYPTAGPIPALLTSETIDTIPSEDVMGPDGYAPVFNYSAE